MVNRLVVECLGCLDELARHNSVQLVWVPGHEGVLGNERADELAKKGADTSFTGRARTWPTVQPGQASNRGMDGEKTHRIQEVWQRL